MKLIEGKVAAVTGAADYENMGAGIARAFSEQGAAVVCCDIQEALARETAARLAEETGGTVIGMGVDITDPRSAADTLQGVVERFGRLDILVNNAGYLQRSSFLAMTKENFSRTMKVNALGTFLMTQAAARIMGEQGGGRIINIGSTSGKKPCAEEAAYGASKLAVIGIT